MTLSPDEVRPHVVTLAGLLDGMRKTDFTPRFEFREYWRQLQAEVSALAGLLPENLPLSDAGAEAEAAGDSAEQRAAMADWDRYWDEVDLLPPEAPLPPVMIERLAGLGWTVTRTVPPGDDGQCTASSWKASDGSHQPYGPGAYNRCTRDAVPAHAEHVDDFGNVFLFNPHAAGGQRDPRVKVIRHQPRPAQAGDPS